MGGTVCAHRGYLETGKNRGLKREAELILLYYVPHEPLSRWIPPWAPKQKQSSLAPGFSWSLFKTGVKICTKRTGVQARPHS